MWVMRLSAHVMMVGLVLFGAVACRDRGGSEQELAAIATPPGAGTTALPGAAPTRVARAAGASQGLLTHDGRERTYRLFIPSNAGTGKLPLVVALHGGLGTGSQLAVTTNFEALAEREGFAVVFPDGIDRTWNGGACCNPAVRQNIDDVGFLAALIGELVSENGFDPSRVFMTGHSNGAIMSFRFACERAGLVAAIAPVAGSLEIPACNPSRGVHLLDIHGDADRNHPLEGGMGERSIANVAFRSTQETMRLWNDGMRCTGSGSTSTAGALSTTTWSGCRDGVTSKLTVIAGADHPWPGSGDRRVSQLQGVPSQELDATATAWQFFESVAPR